MPLKKRASKKLTTRRRPALRRPRRGFTTWVNKRSLNPIPQRSIVKMKYCDGVTMTIGAGAATAVQAWNLNSIYDPDRTGTGHQPYAHDTFSTLYNRYRVIGVKYNIFINNLYSANASSQYPIQLIACPTNDDTTVTYGSELREKPRAKYIVQAAGAPSRKLSGFVSLPSLTGRTKSQYMADDRYQATFGASPNEVMVLNTVVGYPNDSVVGGNSQSVTCNIELTYIVECFDPKILAQS